MHQARHQTGRGRLQVSTQDADRVEVLLPLDPPAALRALQAALEASEGAFIGEFDGLAFEVGPADPWAPVVRGELIAVEGGARLSGRFVASQFRRQFRVVVLGGLALCAAAGIAATLSQTGTAPTSVLRAVSAVGGLLGLVALLFELGEDAVSRALTPSRERTTALLARLSDSWTRE